MKNFPYKGEILWKERGGLVSHFSTKNEKTHSMEIKLNSWLIQYIKYIIFINCKMIVSVIQKLDILYLNL